jgi:two-component system, NarL family, sensor histidine kinase DegS
MVMAQQNQEMSRDSASRHTTDEFTTKVSQLMGELRVESEALQRELAELEMLVRQSSQEVEKLAQRELGSTNRVRDMELNLDNYSRTDMKTIYNSAHEIQMRLFMMRAQVEQLEAKRNSMKILQARIQRVVGVLMSAPEGYSPSGSTMRQLQQTHISSVLSQDDGESVDSREMISNVIQAQENERLRVSRQIHDGPAQTMTNLVLRAEICERLLDMDPSRAKAELSGLKSVVNATLQETRRFIFDLRPMILDDLGLEPTLRRYVQQYIDKHKIEVGVVLNGLNSRLPNEMEVAIFRIVQEALANAAQHSHAKHIQVSIDANTETIRVLVEDDGSGFTVDDSKVNNPKFRGLSTMRQRAEMLGGQITIDSTQGRGTRVVANLPADMAA